MNYKCSCPTSFTYSIDNGTICEGTNDTIRVAINSTEAASGGYRIDLTGDQGTTAQQTVGVQGDLTASAIFPLSGISADEDFTVTVYDEGKTCDASTTVLLPLGLTVNQRPTVSSINSSYFLFWWVTE